MCGLLGKISWSKNKNDIPLNGELIKNRGPDSLDSFNNKNLKLMHSRLGIINKEKQSSQPLINDNLILICNGEILNYKQLKRFIKFEYKTNSINLFGQTRESSPKMLRPIATSNTT